MQSKYGKVLTILLIVLIIAIIGILIFLGAKYYKDYEKAKETQGVIHQFDDHLDNDTNQNNTPSGGEDITPDIDLNELIASNNNNGNSGDSSKVTYRGYEVMGKIKIPTTGLETIILEKVTPSSIESSVAILYGPGLNKVGNTGIVGHNYRNGQMFSNNKNLSIGDKIYITDKTGTEVAYTITKKYQTSAQDFNYATRDVQGRREISLSTCTDDSSGRLIIWAAAD